MIVKWFFLASYLSISCANSYVLFAANIDDFRSLAKKVMPGQLGEQLAKIAAKRGALTYRHDNDNAENGDNDDDEEVSEAESNYSTEEEDSNYSDGYYRTVNPVAKEIKKPFKKKYLIYNESIDLDELVKKVKEKLEHEYNVSTLLRNQANNEPSQSTFSTSGHKVQIDDYYYKDDNMNADFNKDAEDEATRLKQLAYTVGVKKYDVASQYNGEDLNGVLDYTEIDTQANAEQNIGYVSEELYESNNRPVTVKQQLVPTQKYIVQYAGEGLKLQKNYEYENVNPKREAQNIKIVTNARENYKNHPEQAKDDTKETIGKKYVESKEKDIPEYYEDNAKDKPIEPSNYGDLFKGVDMLIPSNDSYEDYVIPKPDKIFESHEYITTRRINNPVSGVQFVIENKKTKPEETKSKTMEQLKGYEKVANINDDVITPPLKKITVRTPFIRAKTASLWYKDPNIENYDESKKKIREDLNRKTTKKQLRTMFPTREHIKISSPNYFAKLPVVAEKYNFDEPIPERDRGPELIKYIGNPPAMINNKVKI